ncbi:MAG: AraC-like DNA-binding protein [Pseudohongiellaceae bacterium]|jgi:AraC-like DNA-binding protein
MSNEYAASSFLDTLKLYLESNDHRDQDLLGRIVSLQQRYHWRMPKTELLSLLSIINLRYPSAALGFRIGRSLQTEHYGMVGYMAVTCSSLGQAFHRYQQHLKLVESTIDTTFEERGTCRVIRWWHNDANAKGIFGELGLMVFVNFYQALIGRDIAPEFVELPGEPNGDPNIYELLIGCPVIFNAKAVGIAIPKALYSMTISTSDPYLRSLYDRQAAALLTEVDDKHDFLMQAKHALKECLQEGDSSAKIVASKMSLSLRTFYRRLEQNGLRFRSLLADTRFALAKAYLKDDKLSLAEISLMLGYSEQSAFTRAFASWSGFAPSNYRNLD